MHRAEPFYLQAAASLSHNSCRRGPGYLSLSTSFGIVGILHVCKRMLPHGSFSQLGALPCACTTKLDVPKDFEHYVYRSLFQAATDFGVPALLMF